MSVSRAAVDRLGLLFLEGDVDAVLEEFAYSDALIYAGSESGEVAVGRAALRALLVELFSREERYSWLAGDVHEVTGGDTVHLVAEVELTVHARDGGTRWRPEERLPYRLSGVLQHEPGPAQWRWRMCLGSEPVVPTPE